MKKIVKAITNPNLVFAHLWVIMSKIIKSDKLYLKVLYFLKVRKRLDFENPETFTAKLQKLKLSNTSSLCTKMVDKYEVRELVAKKIGEEYLIPLLGVWERFEDIKFDTLPDQFVLKTTHDSGGIVICKDKSTLDYDLAKKKLMKSLKNNYFYNGREYPYKNVKPRIIAEAFMVDSVCDDLRDYKFFCFSGEPKVLFIAEDRFKGGVAKFTFYDTDLNLLPFAAKGHERSDKKPEIVDYEKMLELAKILSEDFPHIRVDLYNINGKIYFGEFTFHHDGGLVPFIPEEWDGKLGDMINI